MNNQLKNQKKRGISSSHRHLLIIVWKIHQGIRNGTDKATLRAYLEHIWDTELRGHFLNEEIFISSNIKHNHAVTDTFFHRHGLFRKKVKQALDPQNENLVDTLENLCILLIEMVRYEERVLKPFLSNYVSDDLLEEYDEDDTVAHQGFLPQFWNL